MIGKRAPKLTTKRRRELAGEEILAAEASVQLVLAKYAGRNKMLVRWLETAQHALDGALQTVT